MCSSPAVQIFPCLGTFHGTVVAFKSVTNVRQFILQEAWNFVAVHSGELKVKHKWRRKAAEHGVPMKAAYFGLIMPSLVVSCTFSVFPFSSFYPKLSYW